MHQESYLSRLPSTDWKPSTTNDCISQHSQHYKPCNIYHVGNIYNKKPQKYSYGERKLDNHSNTGDMTLQKQQQDVFAIFNRNNIQHEHSLLESSLPFQQQQLEIGFPIDESLDYSMVDPNFCFQPNWLFLDNTTLMTQDQGFQEKGNITAHASDSLFNDNQPCIINDPLFYSGSSISSSTKYCSSVNSSESNHDNDQVDKDEEKKQNIAYNKIYINSTEEEVLDEEDDEDDSDSYGSDWYQSNITFKKKKRQPTAARKNKNTKKYANSMKHKKSSPSPNNYHQSQGTRCSNCRTFNTPLWRRNPQGQPLCNACGLFFKLHGTVRPLSLKTDVIKKRNRSAAPTKNSKRKKANSSSYMTKNQNMLLDNASFSADENFIIDDHLCYDFFM